MGGAVRKVFQSGGTIGRLRDNDWVLPDEYISGRHAKITFANGSFSIEDTSTNGVFINSPQNRMTRGQPYVLRNGDTVFIDDYEVRVTLSAESSAGPGYSPLAGFAATAAPSALIPDDPMFGDEFGLSGANSSAAPGELDPLSLLGIQDARAVPAGPSAASLASQSPLSQHYRPPAAAPPPPPPPLPMSPPPLESRPAAVDRAAPDSSLIPDDYDPFAADDPPPAPKSPRVVPATPAPIRSAPAAQAPARAAQGSVRATQAPVAAPPPSPSPRSAAGPQQRHAATASPMPQSRASVPESAPPVDVPAESPQTLASNPVTPARLANRPAPAAGLSPAAGAPAWPRPSPSPAATPPNPPASLDFNALLAAAGIESARVTPELAEQFGQILRVVVAGLMDVLRARERIKDEFRMRMTTFKQADNNPLKFSANVEDALHNLLVKRNAAYLGPVEAFDDAFQDLRNHQMAMLAGMRVAYEAMLKEFEPERLQEEFDRHLKAGSFLSGPSKMKYWELYRNRFHDMVKDADSSFRDLFGDEFAKAYEEQLARLKTLKRADRR
jgi:predicted component of type VI protein secretion system